MKKLKMTLIIICILIILLLGGNIALFIIRQNNEHAEGELSARLETISLSLSNYAYPPKNQRDDNEYTRIEAELKSIINDSKDQDITTSANLLLAFLYFYKDDNTKRSISLLDTALNNNTLSDQNKYAILNAKLQFYTNSGDTANKRTTLQKILELPETMKLPLEDWSVTRKYYEKELEKIED